MQNTDNLWQAVQRRNSSFDGRFFYGVMTTGVFRRPGCGARTPLRQNVRFYETAQAAAADGLRPCKRCNPLDPPRAGARAGAKEIARYIDRHREDPAALKLSTLSSRFGLSPFHLQRTFKSEIGVTPRQYAEGLRVASLKEDLRTAGTVTEAIYSAGFNSSSSVYSGVDATLGMTPKQYREGGKAVEISHVTIETPLGLVMIGATSRGLCFVEFGDSPAELLDALRSEFPKAALEPMKKPYPEQFRAWIDGLVRHLKDAAEPLAAPLDLAGTAFQLKVWNYLRTIPAGTVQTYTEVARAVGHPAAVRAVAGACAANRVAVAVPCHRVIRGDGGLAGYRWGVARKQALLESEKRLPRVR
jgi:AraC family transcriptional regulator of adaptative response/methylated-DNA-[protein]-cysteine methyltransferase